MVTTTTWWPLSARLSEALAGKSARVSALCPARHPLHVTLGVEKVFSYRSGNPMQAIAQATATTRPDLIIPCDDRAARHLHRLHAEVPVFRALIEKSLGDPAHFHLSGAREPLLMLARQEGVAVPPTMHVSGETDLRDFMTRHPFPWVLKLDQSWGGRGVRIVNDIAGARRAFLAMSKSGSLPKAIKSLVVNRDPFPLREWQAHPTPGVSVQDFVAGRAANCLAACWAGDVVDEISVEVLDTTGPTGAATVVRPIDHSEMSRAVRKLVRRLGVSGLCGFDFMLEPASGRALLIEMNPRTTQLGHLVTGQGHDLVAALITRLTGQTVAPSPSIPNSTVALFPAAIRQRPPSPHLALAYHDIPLDDLGLARELLRNPRTNRSLLSRANGWWHAGEHGRREVCNKRPAHEKRSRKFRNQPCVSD